MRRWTKLSIVASKKTTINVCPLFNIECSDEYAQALHKINAPCHGLMTIWELRTALPSLKNTVDKIMKSNGVYDITCPGCHSCYVEKTNR